MESRASWLLLVACSAVLLWSGCKKDNGACVGDCVCEGGDCVCPSTGDCEIHCGDDCNLTCAGSGNCDFICDVACDVACTNTGECLVDVRSGSTVSCTSSGDCHVTCHGDCSVDCSGSGDCIVYCLDGGSCNFLSCNGDEHDCGDNTMACGTGCP